MYLSTCWANNLSMFLLFLCYFFSGDWVKKHGIKFKVIPMGSLSVSLFFALLLWTGVWSKSEREEIPIRVKESVDCLLMWD